MASEFQRDGLHGLIETSMALYRPGEQVPRSGFYQCIFCRSLLLCIKGSSFPECPCGCANPAYSFARKDK
jgi:hypothetical protein